LPVFSIRDAGAVPAAIAVVDGALRVGLDEALLERFARGADIMKLSRADVAWGLVSVRLDALSPSPPP
jgi:pseudouridine-5'-phosphate glycosidase